MIQLKQIIFINQKKTMQQTNQVPAFENFEMPVANETAETSLGITTNLIGKADNISSPQISIPPAITLPLVQVISFTPQSAPVGAIVEVVGLNFNSTAMVYFNGVPATEYPLKTATLIRAKVPAVATSGPLEVANQFGPSGVAPYNFTLLESAQITVDNFMPMLGQFGSLVYINGMNLNLVNQVFFTNNITANIESRSNDQIVVSVPVGCSSGPIKLVSFDGVILNTVTAFNVITENPLTFRTFTPESGSVGDKVAILGSGFNEVIKGAFGAVQAVIDPLSPRTDNTLTLIVPAGAVKARIFLTAGDGNTVNSSVPFTVLAPLTITNFNPISGRAGTSIVINGTGFTTVQRVAFNGKASSYTVLSDNMIRATVPPGATSGLIRLKRGTTVVDSITPFVIL